MTVFVDALRAYPLPPGASPMARRTFGGKTSCHLTAEDLSPEAVDELHALAARIGLRREWFQPTSFPHYDLTPGRRARAVSAGAVEETPRAGALRRIAARGKARATP